jgi:colanic acid biosynthesis glycosyl transferase WcaI
MKCVVHDYAGHPFQVELSRQLARRGHDVHHLYFADNPGPKGQFEQRPDDPPLKFIGITLGTATNHAAGTGQIGLERRFGEVAYGRKVAEIIKAIKPDVVLSGNTPTEAQQSILRACKRIDTRFVYWVQDVYSMAVTKLLSKQLGIAGRAIGWYYQRLDRQQFRESDRIVVISMDFVPLVTAWAGRDSKISVIENWAAIDDLPVGVKTNAWACEHDLCDRFTFLYSGTLGRKHNPMLLVSMAQQCGSGEAVVAVTQGHGLPILQSAKAQYHLDALRLLPLQPAERLADVLATADVLVATIEPDAGTFAVPSKVLSYLCAGRPILLSAPAAGSRAQNLAARIVQQANAGIVVEAGDAVGFLSAARRLRYDERLRVALGANGRAYAEQAFDMQRITDKFEHVLFS